MRDWQDMIVRDRMTVDDEFSSRVESSEFSRQEWGLIMTAVSFEIENPEDEANAELVVDTSQLRSILPELDKVASMGPMGASQQGSGAGGGILDSLRDALGLGGNMGGGVDEKRLEEAKKLVSAYADMLQTHLESEDRWDQIRNAAAED